MMPWSCCYWLLISDCVLAAKAGQPVSSSAHPVPCGFCAALHVVQRGTSCSPAGLFPTRRLLHCLHAPLRLLQRIPGLTLHVLRPQVGSPQWLTAVSMLACGSCSEVNELTSALVWMVFECWCGLVLMWTGEWMCAWVDSNMWVQ